MTLWPTDEIANMHEAVDFLRSRGQKPLPLTPVQWGSNLKVVVEVSASPRVWFGHDETSGSWEADLNEIIRVLREHGIEAELSLESGHVPPPCSP